MSLIDSCVFFTQGPKTRFLDTMSMHIAVAGFTSLQRMLYIAKKSGSQRKEVLEHAQNSKRRGNIPVSLGKPLLLYYDSFLG